MNELVENRIREAIDAGAFENLEGEGRPIRIDDAERLFGERWMGYRILQNHRVLPPWLALAKEIEAAEHAIERLDHEHAAAVAAARHAPDPAPYRPLIASLREQFAEQARRLRAKQDRFNIEAPGRHTQRPSIWVEHRLAKLDERAAGL